jgi:hypothetical protein
MVFPTLEGIQGIIHLPEVHRFTQKILPEAPSHP